MSASETEKHCVVLKTSSEMFREIVGASGTFHDAPLSDVVTRPGVLLSFKVWRPFVLLPGALDAQSEDIMLEFNLCRPEFSDNWGSDEEICLCIIYDLFIEAEKFAIHTGDGSREGVYDPVGSFVRLHANKDFIDAFKV